ncbi:MAG: MvaI/BcnI family restriction endonuclease [Burkholderiales bacterium]|jgi:hypothetical protein|nr:MvaI/BcnI family restriction endonuclease [Betaproteobacteria bacterium]
MNTRPLVPNESSNLAALNAAGFTSTLLFVTATGLEKAILDATLPMRTMMRDAGVHDFATQEKGPSNKVVKQAVILSDTGPVANSLSLYRPLTKDGDPRMWFYGFKEHAQAGDVFAIFIVANQLHAMNLSRVHLGLNADDSRALRAFLSPFKQSAEQIAEELLSKLRSLAQDGPIRAICGGDTAVGMSIEAALGIRPNSSRKPDYKGIELKSGRSAIGTRSNRATLFASVPDWQLSNCKSSAEILAKFGYTRGSDFKLYCTVSTLRPNSQLLQFRLAEAERYLHEEAVKTLALPVAIWTLPQLEARLAEKHRETFWIKATSETRSGSEWFHLKSVLHTRNPNIPQFERLVAEGAITMDHLIKRTPAGGAAEKGPLFKIQRNRIPELFLGEPVFHSLN